jgi:hypothetical protein
LCWWCFHGVKKLRRGRSDPITNTGLATQGLAQKYKFGILTEEGGGGGVNGFQEVKLTRNGRNGDRVKKKEEQKCCGVRASVLLTGGVRC